MIVNIMLKLVINFFYFYIIYVVFFSFIYYSWQAAEAVASTYV